MTAPQVEVQLSDGRSVPLASLYADRPLALVFLRHFGCIFCREQVAELRDRADWNVAFVTVGDRADADQFKRKMRSPHLFVADPRGELYRAFGLARGKARQMLSPAVFARGFGAALKGHGVGRPIGDPWQLAGTFIVETDGSVSWEHRAVDAADNADPEAIGSRLRAKEKA